MQRAGASVAAKKRGYMWKMERTGKLRNFLGVSLHVVNVPLPDIRTISRTHFIINVGEVNEGDGVC